MATSRKEVEPLVLIKTDYCNGLVLPASLASAVLPHLRWVEADYNKPVEFKDKQLEFTVLSSDQHTTMLVTEKIVKEQQS
jgi:hypothetical protein